MESQPQIPEFRINPENFHPCRLLSIHVAPIGSSVVNQYSSVTILNCPTSIIKLSKTCVKQPQQRY